MITVVLLTIEEWTPTLEKPVSLINSAHSGAIKKHPRVQSLLEETPSGFLSGGPAPSC